MRQVAIFLFLSLPVLTSGQIESEVNVADLIREVQQWNKKDNKMNLVWWIPNEYWRIALKGNKQISQEAIDQFENVFKDYLLIWACDILINADGTMSYASEEEINRSIKVFDNNKKEYLPLAKSQIRAEALTIAENVKPFFSQAVGQLGQGTHFYFFQVADQNGKNLIDAKLEGEFRVSHSNSDFFWKLPLSTLIPPKICPVDKGKMKGTWKYCPIHGRKLEN
ncbi:MAG: hypothetical protein R2820_00420 [Cyclobacteriaceae bacterium]